MKKNWEKENYKFFFKKNSLPQISDQPGDTIHESDHGESDLGVFVLHADFVCGLCEFRGINSSGSESF